MTPNCCTNLYEVVDWFKDLKEQGVSRDDVLDVLEFDSDEYPDYNILRQAREIVYDSKPID